MVIINKEGSVFLVSGKTYEFKEKLKELGGRWKREERVWEVPEQDGVLEQLKSFKLKRACGYCGEYGHFKPKCVKYKDENIRCTIAKAEALCHNPGIYYKRFLVNPECKCKIEKRRYEKLGISVDEPYTCWACNNFCCSRATMCGLDDKYLRTISGFNFKCEHHGSHQEREHWRLVNDTSGT
jgi:hypothetical protein